MGVTKRGKVWYVKWRDALGRWRRERTDAETKKAAQTIHAELVNQVDRQLKGLEARPMKSGLTVWGLCDWWLKERCKKASLRRCRSLLEVHVKRSGLGGIPLNRVNPDAFDDYFTSLERLKRPYKPRSINLLRLNLMSVFTQAAKSRKWGGPNPMRATHAREVIKTPRPVLKSHEVEPVINEVPPQWQNFFATAFYLGLRKGELCGVLKTDYDQARRTLYVGRSYGANTTKGKRVDLLPVTPALAPYLNAALTTPGPFLLPGPKGRMRKETCNPEKVLRAALRRLGFIEGWKHKCRRCARQGIRAPVIATDDEPRWCERCGFKLWPVAIARTMTFHDARHACATHLLQTGADIHLVQRVLRHSNIATTAGTYAHLMTEDLRAALEKLGPQPGQIPHLRQVKPIT